MRIVRPGSVVGPQQQYMYVKQMEWVKWSAVDEMRRAEAQAAAAIAAASVRTPATPPAETDEEVGTDAMEVSVPVVPSTPRTKSGVPPVTPSKHVSAATARARAIEPPGQPRKTPLAKRSAAESVEESEEGEEEGSEDELNALPSSKIMTHSAPARGRVRAQVTVPSRGTVRRGITASEQRPARVTRSTATTTTGAHPRRVGTSAHAASSSVPSAVPSSPTKGSTSGPSPNKIPRITQRPASPQLPARSTTSMGTRSRLPPTVPNGAGTSPSRLPTLAPTSRRANTAQGVVTRSGAAAATKGGSKLGVPVLSRGKDARKEKAEEGEDAWMKNNPGAVVVPASKGERPGLRSVRRRRSSFSAADIVT